MKFALKTLVVLLILAAAFLSMAPVTDDASAVSESSAVVSDSGVATYSAATTIGCPAACADTCCK